MRRRHAIRLAGAPHSTMTPTRDETCRIVYVPRFCDEQGHLTRHRRAPVFSAAPRTTAELTSEGPDSARVTVTMTHNGKVSAEEVDAFIDQRLGMTKGSTGSFGKLESFTAETTGD